MEYINRIELQGLVGSIRSNIVNGCKVANFSLATEAIYRTSDGFPVVEVTWHNVVAWEESAKDCDLSEIGKGSKVRVLGRLRTSKYTGANGEEKIYYEVIASEVSIVKE